MAPSAEPVAAAHPMAPAPYRVTGRRVETSDVVTLSLEPLAGPGRHFRSGQFNMLTAFGVGEAAISISSPPAAGGPIEHTVRDVGAVTHALCSATVGSIVGVRGPFGTDWGVDELDGRDVVVVAGGIGLAPLRGAVSRLVEGTGRAGPTGRAGRVFVLVGARSPDQIAFAEDLRRWRDAGAEVEVTVDVAKPGWDGPVGVVTQLLPTARFEPSRTTALVCGPEIMMRFTIRALEDRGVAGKNIKVSLERNMQCGIGWCGHCQLGPLFVCLDGPVVGYRDPIPSLLAERER